MPPADRTRTGGRRDGRLGLVFVVLATFVVAGTVAFAAATVLRAREAPVVTGGPTLPPAVWPNADREHADIVFSYLGAAHVDRPLVVLLGGSAARECTVSDRSWRDEIRADGGPEVLAFNLAFSEQSFDDNIAMVRALPGPPALVFIGVNLGRYTHTAEGAYTPPDPGPALTLDQVDDYEQHYFNEGAFITQERKIARIEDFWLGERQAVFDENFDYNAGRLRALVELCEQRGLHPVLLALPLNLTVVAGRLDAHVERFRRDCRAVAEEYDVPFVDFIAQVPLITEDFVDGWHLFRTGRVKWQKELSRVTVEELSRAGIGAAPSAGP